MDTDCAPPSVARRLLRGRRYHHPLRLLAGLRRVALLLPALDGTENGRLVALVLRQLRSLRAQLPTPSREHERPILGDVLQGVLDTGERNMDGAGDCLLLVRRLITDVDQQHLLTRVELLLQCLRGKLVGS